MSPALLAAFAAALALLVPARLGRAGWVLRAPRVAILAWHCVGYGLLVTVALAALVALMHWTPGHDLACASWRICLDALRGAHGVDGQVAAFAGLGMLVLLAARLASAWREIVTSGARYRARHRTLLSLAGTVRPDLDATVLPAPAPAAYLVPGRRPQIVVTTAALDRLAPAELAAVLAHERAHAAAHHHRLRTAAGLLSRAFPRLAVFTHASHQIDRLLELCADDAAVTGQGRLPLARALVSLAAPGPHAGPIGAAGGHAEPIGAAGGHAEPIGAAGGDAEPLGAAGGDPVERLNRLLDPPRPLPGAARVALTAGWSLVPMVPVLIVAFGRL